MDGLGPDGSGGPHVFVEDLVEPILSEADHHHLTRALRLRGGEAMTISDGQGGWSAARFGEDLGRNPTLEGDIVVVPTPTNPVAIGFALIKGSRPELVVQKLTELGVDRIRPLIAERSVVRWDDQKTAVNLERFRRVAREAAMQSRRVRLPKLEPPARIVDMAPGTGVAMADRGGGQLESDVEELLIGPEGGWTDLELDGRRTVNLGSTVLRAETAAIAAGALLVALRDGRLNSSL